MWGQWLGTFNGTNDGDAILNIDIDRQNFGRISIYDRTTNTPARWADVYFTHSEEKTTGNFQYIENAPQIPGITPASHGTLEFEHLTDIQMLGTWSTNIGTHGKFNLKRANEDEPTKADHTFLWPELIEWLHEESQNKRPLLFRGQSNSKWRLKTTFHRTGRFDLIRYGNEDVNRLNQNLASLLNKLFNLNDAHEYGALLNLAQHHGYPTPLLDWTESPYIGAFFAFSEIPKRDEDGYARIFVFNIEQWVQDHPVVSSILEQREYFAAHQLVALHNPRALPQQSVVTSTNISDIETWLEAITPTHRHYLIKIDIPKSERPVVMKELAKMGITCASLFPGIEGSCKALKERYF